LSTTTMKAFNDKHPDSHGVPLFSFAAYTEAPDAVCEQGAWTAPVTPWRPGLLSDFGHAMVNIGAADKLVSDGIVPTRSASFGHFVGCVPGDHVVYLGTGGVSLFPSQSFGFDHKAFLREVAHASDDVEKKKDAMAFFEHAEAFARLAHATIHKKAKTNDTPEATNTEATNTEATKTETESNSFSTTEHAVR
jgi:hypothetical protein